MAWDFSKFLAEYKKGECSNRRCLNRKDAIVDMRLELMATQALVKKVLMRASESDSYECREIYAAIANFNLGHRNHDAELPRANRDEQQ